MFHGSNGPSNCLPHSPARAPKPNRPGTGRPLGSKSQRPATRYDVGKTVRRPETITQRDEVRTIKNSESGMT
ncbi:hypothetical protein Slala03_76510 [Streptomyces lavendulae subsp. lavendulae]|nr:hypothetical protein Slala03_76510 [Streptomyces lavendulae subsp. lavendulae]